MIRAILILAIVAAGAMLLGGDSETGESATLGKITPSKGKVGNAGIIHGDGFKGQEVEVKFGQAPANNVVVPSDDVVKFDIPNRSATDPATVSVTVKVGGSVVGGTLTFQYDPPGQPPLIDGFAPPAAPAFTPLVVTFTGSNFTTPAGRTPSSVVAVATTAVDGTIVPSPNDASFEASFSAGLPPGTYEIVVGFSDGSGASATGFVVS